MDAPTSTSKTIDVVGIGNALVDVISHESDDFVAGHGLVKGSMNLIDSDRALQLYEAMGPGVEMSGGSAANTVVGVAGLGGSAAYVGKVAADQLGAVFHHDLHATGVEHIVELAHATTPTGRCLVMVSPDAERTMNTFLGASVELTEGDVDVDRVAQARLVYLEGYLWDRPDPMKAMLRVAQVANDAGSLVSLTLSDSFCVERHRDSFLDLITNEVDLLFANHDEIVSLFEVDTLDEAIREVGRRCAMTAITRGAEGSLVVRGDDVLTIPAEPVSTVVDTTGAGDLYAAGFLFGLARDLDATTCGRLGSLAAAEVISHVGARPQASLADLARKAGIV